VLIFVITALGFDRKQEGESAGRGPSWDDTGQPAVHSEASNITGRYKLGRRHCGSPRLMLF
jgi:hypothetical protein